MFGTSWFYGEYFEVDMRRAGGAIGQLGDRYDEQRD